MASTHWALQDRNAIHKADAHIALLECQAECRLSDRNVMPEEELLLASLSSGVGLDTAFKVLVAAGSSFRRHHRYSPAELSVPPLLQARGYQ